MRIIAERRCFGLLALAKPDFFFFIKLHFHTAERHAFHLLVCAVAKGFLGG